MNGKKSTARQKRMKRVREREREMMRNIKSARKIYKRSEKLKNAHSNVECMCRCACAKEVTYFYNEVLFKQNNEQRRQQQYAHGIK